MPSVPRREPASGELRGLQAPGFSTEPPGSSLVQSTERLGQAIQQGIGGIREIVRDQQQKANEVAVADFDAQATQLETTLLYDKDSGAMTRRGKDALAIYNPTQEAYQKGVENLIGGLSDPRQRQAATLLAQKRWTAIDRSLQTHMAEQSRVHILEVGKTKVENSLQLAIFGKRQGPDPDTGETPVTRSVRETSNAIEILGRNSGLDEATIKQMQAGAVSNIHSSVIASYLAENDPKLAEAYFKANKKAMDPKDAERIEPLVRNRALELDLSRIANKSLTVTSDDGMVNLEESVRKAREEAIGMGLKPLEVDAAEQATLTRARISDAQTKDRQEADERLFINLAIDQQKRGITFDKAQEELFSVRGFAIGVDNATALRRNQQLASLYSKDASFYEDAINKMDSGQKLAWEQIKVMAEAKFGKDTVKLAGQDFETNAADAYLLEMKRQVIGQSPEQMMKIAEKSLEHIPVPKTWFKTRAVYEASYEERVARDASVAKLQSDPVYGVARVTASQQRLRDYLRREPTPAEIKLDLDDEAAKRGR
jgi:hypothetical protein